MPVHALVVFHADRYTRGVLLSTTVDARSSMAKPLIAWIRVVTLEGMGREKGMCAVEDEMK
jgi:hypothetical protein